MPFYDEWVCPDCEKKYNDCKCENWAYEVEDED